MVKILVADDDAQITKGLTSIIRETYPDYAVYEASNGQEAWELLRQTDIDAVLTDISMPVMSGIDLLENIRKAELNISVIIISGYDDYDFVHRTMLKGAVDYLLKPIQKHALLEALGKAIERKNNGTGNWERFQLAEATYDYLESRNYQPREAILNDLQKHGIDDESSVCIIYAKGSGFNLSEIGSDLKAALYANCAKYVIYRVRKDVLGVICFFCEATNAKRVADSSFREYPGIQYVCSTASCRTRDLPGEIQNCKTELERMWFDETFDTVLIGPGKNAETLFSELTSNIMKLESESTEGCTVKLLHLMAGEGAGKEFIIKSFLNWHISLLGEISELVSIVGRYTFSPNDFTIQIPQSESLSALRMNLCRILKVYISDLSRGRDRRKTQMEAAKKYIQDHLPENPTINDVAEITGLHPNYFSTLFREYEGITFRDYMRNAKIQEAIRLMKETNLKINEIAEMVGYPDPAHFSRAFKQVTGVPPQQYGKEKS